MKVMSIFSITCASICNPFLKKIESNLNLDLIKFLIGFNEIWIPFNVFDKKDKNSSSCSFALWGVVFCLDLGPFVFFFSCLLVGCFFFSLYYDKFPYTPRKDTTLSHKMFPLEWPIPMFGPPLDSSFVLYYSLLWPMPMPLWALPTMIMVSKHVITRWQIAR